MLAIAIDDEQLMLYALLKAVRASEDIDEVVGFSNCDEALDWAEINTPDVAFLDINMRGINGLGLAEKITALHPDCKIVFCTGYEEYAVSAFKIHASGYLIKPVSAEDVQKEIDVIKGRKTERGVVIWSLSNIPSSSTVMPGECWWLLREISIFLLILSGSTISMTHWKVSVGDIMRIELWNRF